MSKLMWCTSWRCTSGQCTRGWFRQPSYEDGQTFLENLINLLLKFVFHCFTQFMLYLFSHLLSSHVSSPPSFLESIPSLENQNYNLEVEVEKLTQMMNQRSHRKQLENQDHIYMPS
ncbi:hypothetical protein RDI58_019748 [Solanum bulbocastanum]|uniref:Uncharacterized protein n=1 Tax=Solanum bulbocastanum TaxID=147425 RepID=A0AAN8TB67_SOLBU